MKENLSEKIFTPSRVVQNLQIALGIFSMVLHAPEIAAAARPGQFVMVYLERGDLLLPRPISICDADAGAGTIEIVYQVVGKGTAVLAGLFPGCDVRILGACGNGFRHSAKTLRPTRDRTVFSELVAIVGGGIGVPPLYFLAKEMAKSGRRADVFLGFRDAPILEEKFRELAIGEVYVAVENENAVRRHEYPAHRGYVTDLLTEKARDNVCEIFACGPAPMLHAIAKFSVAKKIPCQMSVEERMACGLGTCVGCVVKVGENYVRACTEGPVFSVDNSDSAVLHLL